MICYFADVLALFYTHFYTFYLLCDFSVNPLTHLSAHFLILFNWLFGLVKSECMTGETFRKRKKPGWVFVFLPWTKSYKYKKAAGHFADAFDSENSKSSCQPSSQAPNHFTSHAAILWPRLPSCGSNSHSLAVSVVSLWGWYDMTSKWSLAFRVKLITLDNIHVAESLACHHHLRLLNCVVAGIATYLPPETSSLFKLIQALRVGTVAPFRRISAG